jgi:Domain of unknown function (DUF4476)
MKKLTLLLLTMLSFGIMNAQPVPVSNLVIFSEDGYKFFLVLNGIRQNDKPETNVKVAGLTSPYYTAKIIFEDKALPPIEKKMLMVQDDRGQNLEVTYKIKKDNKGVNVLRFFSQMPTSIAPPPPPGVVTYNYTTVAAPMNTTTVVTPVGTTTTTTTTTMGTGTNVNASIGGVGVNVTVSDPLLVTGSTTVTTSQTTTTTGTMGTTTTTTAPTGTVGCNGAYPMNPGDFNAAVNSITSKGFEESKLTLAKQVSSTNCLNTDQIKKIMSLFGFEESKLDFAKYAYGRCVDRNNYFKINDAFSFESSIDDLNKYIGTPPAGGW